MRRLVIVIIYWSLQIFNQLQNALEQKPLHGQYAQIIRNADIDIVKTNQ